MKEHLQKSDARMAELVAKRDALIALRDGVDAVGSKELAKPKVGKKDAEKRVTSAIALARLQIDKNKNRGKTLDAKLAALKKQRGILIGSLADAAAALKHKTAHRSILRLRRKGIVTDNTFYEAQSDVDDSKGRWNDLRVIDRQVGAGGSSMFMERSRSSLPMLISLVNGGSRSSIRSSRKQK